MPKLIDLTGQIFGRLTVIERSDDPKKSGVHWKCKCRCGTEIIVHGQRLREGITKSCGCFRKEVCYRNAKKTHGMKNTPEYVAWLDMRNRCYRKNTVGYERYGGRGIKVSDKWRNDFRAFYDDIGPKPSRKHSLDRIDNNGDYEPGNIKWSTLREQKNNCRNNRLIVINGQTKTLAQWARIGKNRIDTVWYRLESGWPPEKAVFQPAKH